MDKEFKDKLVGTLIVPFGLAIILVPFSLLIGWNLITLIVFWLVLTPGLTIYLPTVVSASQNQLFKSVVGLIVFYGFIVFLIYEHYKTDYFKVMILSGLVNLVFVSTMLWARRPGTPTPYKKSGHL